MELQDYANQSDLTYEEVVSIYVLFRFISTIVEDDGVIDYEEFCKAHGINDSPFF